MKHYQSHMKKTPFRRLIDAGILEFAVLDGGAENMKPLTTVLRSR